MVIVYASVLYTARKSNLVVTTGDYHPLKILLRRDVKTTCFGLLVRFRWSKTIQSAERDLIIPVVAISRSKLCPVRAFRSMVEYVPAHTNDPAFCWPGTLGNVPVTYHEFQTFLRSCLKLLGFDESKYSSHSFRRGGATWANMVGVPPEMIQIMGDWQSDSYMRYIKVDLAQRLQVAKKLTTPLQLC